MLPLIAIDGPAGAGKSTTSREVAKRLGVPYLDTGALYRAVACGVKQKNISPDNIKSVAGMLKTMKMTVLESPVGTRVWIDTNEVTDILRSKEITRIVTPVCEITEVRNWLQLFQRKWASRGFGVLEGRDIGTVVVPDAGLKIFMTASPEVRAMRRAKQNGISEDKAAVEQLAKEIAQRDARDSKRVLAPMIPAEDAVEFDNSEKEFEEQVNEIICLAEARFNMKFYFI